MSSAFKLVCSLGNLLTESYENHDNGDAFSLRNILLESPESGSAKEGYVESNCREVFETLVLTPTFCSLPDGSV